MTCISIYIIFKEIPSRNIFQFNSIEDDEYFNKYSDGLRKSYLEDREILYPNSKEASKSVSSEKDWVSDYSDIFTPRLRSSPFKEEEDDYNSFLNRFNQELRRSTFS